MGARVETYTNTVEDYAEKPTKNGLNLQNVFESTKLANIVEVYNLVFEPNKWNIFHLACWYNNFLLLTDLISHASFDKQYLDAPDINKEPPIAICCIVDSVDCLKLLVEAGAKKAFSSKEEEYRKGLNLNKLCVYHDAAKCFSYLNPDITIDSNELDECYDLAKKNGSDFVVALFEDIKIYDELDSVLEIQDEDLMEKLDF